MEKLNDVILFLFKNYPNPLELSKARLVKMIYLADWKSAITNSKQLTDVKWYYNHYGPYVNEIIDSIKSDNKFELEWISNSDGEPKELIKLRDKNANYTLSKESQEILKFVIDKTYPLYWSDFINLVYSTYPVKKSAKYSNLDLIEFSNEYKHYIQQRI
jgi:hypothetical protein